MLQSVEDEAQEQQRRQKRKQRIEEMKREKKRAQIRNRCLVGAGLAVCLMAGIGIAALVRSAVTSPSAPPADAGRQQAGNAIVEAAEGPEGPDITQTAEEGTDITQEREPAGEPDSTQEPAVPVFAASATDVTAGFSDTIVSEYGILIDVESGTVLAGRDAHARMNPASMTKILTVLTAAEALGLEDDTSEILNDTFTMTVDITDYCYVNGCSVVGYEVGETATVRDLFYGTILPSGADAALGLAVYVSGSQEAFVELMNQKLDELGLAESTHFVNCVGLYDDQHYSTVYDIAVLLEEASKNGLCRQVLSAHTYTTTFTEEHPEGMVLSNWFLRRMEDRDTHGQVLYGKTGYVKQSGHCAASLASDMNGKEYLCVTAGSSSVWQCIRDQVELFQGYLTEEGST